MEAGIGHEQRFVRNGDGRAGDERSVGEIGRDLATHAQQLVRAEIDRAKAEMSVTARAVGAAAAMGAIAMLGVFAAVILLGIALAQGLAAAGMSAWAGSLVSAGVLLVVAVVLVLIAVRAVKGVSMAPTETIDHAKEDVQWVMRHK